MSEPILSHPDRTSEPILSHPRSCYPKSFPSPDAGPIFPLIFQSIFILAINITSTRLRSKVWPTTRKRQKRQPATPSRQRRLPPSGGHETCVRQTLPLPSSQTGSLHFSDPTSTTAIEHPLAVTSTGDGVTVVAGGSSL